jgi:aspartyl-tRNA(Asn)/glutamyl-tRNA(Gln) amidotransferase subunit A
MSIAASSIVRFSASELAEKLAQRELLAREVLAAFWERIELVDQKVGAYLRLSRAEAERTAAAVDNERAQGQALPPLAGVPIALKDIVVTKGIETTNASKILVGWIPPYDATIVERIKRARMPILGKTNMDEFAMGSSTETSAFQLTRNPWDLERIPGGSSGGSAAAVAAFEAPLAIGTDTGGSIRQPAAVTGTVGYKPTYGLVSRYGLIAMASSLDQAGPMARSVLDTALLQEVIQGHDPRDATSIPEFNPSLVAAVHRGQSAAGINSGAPGLVNPQIQGDVKGPGLKGRKIGVIKQLSSEGFKPGVLARFRQALELYRELGAEIVEVSIPSLKYALGAYYIIQPSEASSNLERFDGMRYGLRVLPTDVEVTAESMMNETRGVGFGRETKRRILLGTYALSAGYYDAYYGSALKVRTLLLREFREAFAQCDVLVTPTSPTPAFKLGEELDDPLTMYMNDIATLPVNLAGLPAISLPCGLSDDLGPELPVGFQIIGGQKADAEVFFFAAALESYLAQRFGDWAQGIRAPALDGCAGVDSETGQALG